MWASSLVKQAEASGDNATCNKNIQFEKAACFFLRYPLLQEVPFAGSRW
jgi:hypothetical protein